MCSGSFRQRVVKVKFSRHTSINQQASQRVADEWRLSASICNIASADARRAEGSNRTAALRLIRADVDERPSWCHADEMADPGRATARAHLSQPAVPSFPTRPYRVSPRRSRLLPVSRTRGNDFSIKVVAAMRTKGCDLDRNTVGQRKLLRPLKSQQSRNKMQHLPQSRLHCWLYIVTIMMISQSGARKLL